MEDASTATEALAQTAADLKAEIRPLVVELGEAFVPLIESAVDAIPTLAEDIIAALGPLDEFASTLAEFGELAMEAIPATVEAFVDLGRRALPFLEDLVGTLADDAAGAFEAMVEVTEVVGDDLLAIADAAGDLIPELTELGAAIIEGVAPGVESLIDGFRDLVDRINDFIDSGEAADIFETMNEELGPLIPRIVDLGKELGPVIDTLIDNVPEITRGLAAFGDTVLDIAEVAVPPLATALEELIDLIGFLSDGYADWVAASERSEKRLAGDIESIEQKFSNAVTQIEDAWVYLTGSGSGTLRGDVISSLAGLQRRGTRIITQLRTGIENRISTLRRNARQTVTRLRSEIENTFDGARRSVVRTIRSLRVGVQDGLAQLRSWALSVWNLHPLSDTFEAVAAAVMGGEESAGIIPTLRRDVQDALNRLRSWVGGVWDLFPLSDAFEAVADQLFGAGGIVTRLVGNVRDSLNQLATFVEETFGVDIEQAFRDAFNAAVSAIGDAFDRLSFSSFENALDQVADGVRGLIDSLNELSGVNINVDVPSFDSLLDRAKEIVEPEPEPEPEPDPGDDGDDENPGDPDDRNESGGDTGVDGGRSKDPDDVLDEPDDEPAPDEGDAGAGGGAGGGSIVATGGYVEETGRALIHEGERVLPAAQITDRGKADLAGDAGGVTIGQLTVNASGRAEGRAAGRALKRELKRFDI
jgi:phage-related protein